jgi:hypothetical protein
MSYDILYAKHIKSVLDINNKPYPPSPFSGNSIPNNDVAVGTGSSTPFLKDSGLTVFTTGSAVGITPTSNVTTDINIVNHAKTAGFNTTGTFTNLYTGGSSGTNGQVLTASGSNSCYWSNPTISSSINSAFYNNSEGVLNSSGSTIIPCLNTVSTIPTITQNPGTYDYTNNDSVDHVYLISAFVKTVQPTPDPLDTFIVFAQVVLDPVPTTLIVSSQINTKFDVAAYSICGLVTVPAGGTFRFELYIYGGSAGSEITIQNNGFIKIAQFS